MKKRVLPLLLALALALTAAGCSTTQSVVNQFNATAYVQGLLDETYTGAASETYMTLMGSDPEQVEETYQANLRSEYQNRFLLRFEIDDAYVTRGLRAQFMELLEQVYAKASWSVKAAVPLDDRRYCVEVSVTPVTFFSAAYSDGFARLVKEFEAENPEPDEDELSDMTEAEITLAHRRRESDWAQTVYDYLSLRLDAITTGAPVTKLLLVSPNSAGYYTVSATDLQDLDDQILAY